ncbi:uncharacterized protein SOCEGT47_074630 [Sorangium cellulosum]|uniref:cysteine desulfurase n=2 Tax=Sorangium cellulosum TaxID=56 RepID=A0A4P2QCP6_SORCE|nr:uncharacterized protein SOCEGT47_074630 [Sorangium cellulosum]
MLGGHYRWPGSPSSFAVNSIKHVVALAAELSGRAVTSTVFLDDIGAGAACAAGRCDVGLHHTIPQATIDGLERWAAEELPALETTLVESERGWIAPARRLRDILRNCSAFVPGHPAIEVLRDGVSSDAGPVRWLRALEMALYIGARPLFRPLLLGHESRLALPPVLLERTITNAASRNLHKARKARRPTGLRVDDPGDGSVLYWVPGLDRERIELRREESRDGVSRAANKCAAILSQLFFHMLKGAKTKRASVFYLVPSYDRARLRDGMVAFFHIYHDLAAWFGLKEATLVSGFYTDPDRSEIMCDVVSRRQDDALPHLGVHRLRVGGAPARSAAPRRIYADNNATTATDPSVLEAMMPYLGGSFGNPSSAHWSGWEAEHAVAEARQRVAESIGADPEEVFFTSGATESNNWLLRGFPHGVLVTSPIEHKSVLVTALEMQRGGREVRMAPITPQGEVDLAALKELITPGSLVSLMAANNEIHTLLDLDAVGELCQQRGALFHTDAAQALGRMPLDVRRARIHAMSLSAHKIHGPKGIGALYVSRDLHHRLGALLSGGGQERNLRAGTLPTALIVGFGAACSLARQCYALEVQRLQAISQRFLVELSAREVRYDIVGPPDLRRRRPGSLCLFFPDIDTVRLSEVLSEIAVSQTSACNGQGVGSHVLAHLGFTVAEAQRMLRIAFGRFNTEEDALVIAGRIAAVLHGDPCEERRAAS